MMTKFYQLGFVFLFLCVSFVFTIFFSFKVADLFAANLQAGFRGEVGRYLIFLIPVLVLPIGSILWLKRWNWAMGSGALLCVSLFIVPPTYAFFLNAQNCVDFETETFWGEIALSYAVHSGLGGVTGTSEFCMPILVSLSYLGLFTLGLLISMLWVFASPLVK